MALPVQQSWPMAVAGFTIRAGDLRRTEWVKPGGNHTHFITVCDSCLLLNMNWSCIGLHSKLHDGEALSKLKVVIRKCWSECKMLNGSTVSPGA